MPTDSSYTMSMKRPLFAILLFCSSDGFVFHYPPLKPPTHTVPSFLASTSTSPLELEQEAEGDHNDEEATPPANNRKTGLRKIIDLGDNSENNNIDDVRRARSLARRDRMAKWRAAAAHVEENYRDQQDNYFLLAAFLPAVLAFLLWGNISIGISKFLNVVGVVNTAGGEAFANNLLRPTIIGVVVPVISIALATLVSTTVNVLRQRQVDLRAFINQEVGELRFLRRAVFGLYG